MEKKISSLQNKTVKYLTQLQEKSRTRRKEKRFVIEGFREITLAIEASYELETIYFCNKIFQEKELFTENFSALNVVELSKEVYQKVAYRGSTEGILAIAKAKENDLASLKFKTENPLILVAEAPEKPGNIGAILRTADAAKVDAVLIANPKTDIYNPNIIRSSVGCVFTNQIASGNTSEIISYLKEKNIAIYSAILQDSEIYTNQDFTSATAIIIGTEADGLSEEWRKAATKNIHIPMQGKIDSMNVSVAAGILIFEAKRQRNFD
ncbi:TrmH family RNA methyltransferase [Mesonia maritima]|uniref:TrmH family RNA methyltransferase n=1 Tax=Mesonia maritima TaxID=1793873 RepID=A0ABU1K4B5_9FLAO|nr:RNA methyltransferase [Mesonia maritima]MDR6300429.1 TrmH family RNA methyltransferase [Mesonia maritima]